MARRRKKYRRKYAVLRGVIYWAFSLMFFFSHNTAPVVRGEDGRLRHGLMVVMTCVLYLPLWTCVLYLPHWMCVLYCVYYIYLTGCVYYIYLSGCCPHCRASICRLLQDITILTSKYLSCFTKLDRFTHLSFKAISVLVKFEH